MSKKLMGSSALSLFAALFVADPSHAQDTKPAPADATASADDGAQAEVVVVGQRSAQRRGLTIRDNADNAVRALSGDEAGKLPDQNIAEAVRRLPGVSTANDQGEGRYVVVRGVNPAYANVTLNGQTAAAPEPESRQVKLDDIPSSIIGAVILTETLTPDQDANAIAGEVNIKTVTAFDRNKDFTQARLAVGSTDLKDHTPVEGDVSVGRILGADRRFGFVAAYNQSRRPITSENFQGSSNWLNGRPDDFRIREYDLVRQRQGAVLNFDLRATDTLSFYFHNTYSKFTDHETRQQFRLPPGALSASSPTIGTFTGQTATRFVRSRNEDDNTITSTIGGKADWGADGVLTAELGYSRAQKKDPLRSEFQFRASSQAGAYDLSDELYVITPTSANANLTSAYAFNSVNYDRRLAVEDLFQGRADYERPVKWGQDSVIKVGVKFIDRDKSNERLFETYGKGSTAFTLANAAGPDGGTIFDDRFAYGPTVNYSAAQAFVVANPTAVKFDLAGSIPNALGSDYEATETITAGYAMARLKYGALTVVPGVRIEHTEATYKAKKVAGLDPNKGFDLSGDSSYTDVFPSVNLRYDFGDATTIRAAITTATGRPDYNQLAPTTTRDDNAKTATLGNPDLEALYAVNYDLGVDFHPNRDTLVSASVFYKSIDNPIYTQGQSVTDYTLAGQTFSGTYFLTQPRNAKSATVGGVELNAQTQFTTLPGALSGLGVGVNYTITGSEAKLATGRRVPLFFQSPEVGTAQIFYEKYGFTGRLAYSYRARYLDTVGSGKATDIYTDANGQLDAKLAYDVNQHLQVYAEGSNLNDESWRRYQAVERQTVEEERYSYTLRAGVVVKY